MNKLLIILLFLITVALNSFAQYVNPSGSIEETYHKYNLKDNNLSTTGIAADIESKAGFLYKGRGAHVGNRSISSPEGNYAYWFHRSSTIDEIKFSEFEMSRLDIYNPVIGAGSVELSDIDSVIFHNKIYCYNSSFPYNLYRYRNVRYLEFKDSVTFMAYNRPYSIGDKYSNVDLKFVGADKIREIGSLNGSSDWGGFQFYANLDVGNVLDLSGLTKVGYRTYEAGRIEFKLNSIDSIIIPNVKEHMFGRLIFWSDSLEYIDVGNSNLPGLEIHQGGKEGRSPVEIVGSSPELDKLLISDTYIDTLDLSNWSVNTLDLTGNNENINALKYLKLPLNLVNFSNSKLLGVEILDLSTLPYNANINNEYSYSNYILPDTINSIRITYEGPDTLDLSKVVVTNKHELINVSNTHVIFPDSLPKIDLYISADSFTHLPKSDTLISLKVFGGNTAIDFDVSDYKYIDLSNRVYLTTDTLNLSNLGIISDMANIQGQAFKIDSRGTDKLLVPNTQCTTPLSLMFYTGTPDTIDLQNFTNLVTLRTYSGTKKLVLPDSTEFNGGLRLNLQSPHFDSIDFKRNAVKYYEVKAYRDGQLKTLGVPDPVYSGETLEEIYYPALRDLDTLNLAGFHGLTIIKLYNPTSLKSLTLDPAIKLDQLEIRYGSFRYLDFISNSPQMFNYNSGHYFIYSCNLSASDVNQYLYDINQVVTNEYSSRRLYLNGNNAAPDASSGGVDGLAAKASLISKGFTVYTN